MLARQPETRPEIDEGTEVPTNRLKVVSERLLLSEGEPRQRRRRLGFISNAISRFREEARLQPERYARLVDRLIVLGIAVVVLVSAYIFIADPG
jgi:hypothetical protein